MTKTRSVVPALALLALSSAHAEPYAFPAGDPHAQILDGSTTVCATWLASGACDVPAGTYTLVTYDADWTQTDVRDVSVGSAPTGGGGGGSGIVRAVETCLIDNPNPASCFASCPGDTVATGGSCEAWTTSIVSGEVQPFETTVGVSSSLGEANYSCPYRGQDVGVDFAQDGILAIVVRVACVAN